MNNKQLYHLLLIEYPPHHYNHFNVFSNFWDLVDILKININKKEGNMGIRIRKVDDFYGIWDSFNCEFLNPAYLNITEQDVRDYIEGKKDGKPHPFPATEEYTEQDMINDVTNSEGSLIIPGTEEQAEWVADMIRVVFI